MPPKPRPTRKRTSNRTHRHVFVLNDEEQRAFERYCAKYKVSNRSRVIRELLIKSILQRMEEDYPTLF